MTIQTATGAGKALFLCLMLAGAASSLSAATVGAQEQSSEPLVVRTAQGEFEFDVELALTGEERAVGLMNRETMDEDAGMLFRFESVRPVTMWMRNTLIPLDMVFIREDATVAGVHENAEPLSESIIASPEPVRYVLELNGGKAAEIGLAEGDTVEHPAIDTAGE